MIENDMVRKVDILEMDPDERVVALGGIIGEAEELRTGASLGGGQFDDDRYNLALEYAVTVAGQYQKPGVLFPEKLARMDSRELAGLAHLYLLISSIGLSRISHTLKTDEEKYGAHYVSEIFFHRAAGIALVLEERNFLETIRGEVFLWPIEIERNEARLYRGAAEIGNREANLIEAQSCYIVAGIKARKIIDNTENSKEVRASALMAFATAMIEQMMVVLELAEIGDEPIDDVAIRDPFEMSLNSMNLAWSQGCREWDRFDAGLARMMAVLDKRRDIQKERTLNELREKVLSRRKSLLGEIVEGEWDEQTKATARSRLESMQTFIY